MYVLHLVKCTSSWWKLHSAKIANEMYNTQKNVIHLQYSLYSYSDKLFPVLGFGAKLPDGSVSHEFPVVSSPLVYTC